MDWRGAVKPIAVRHSVQQGL
ncbi:hypothetical protein CEXT_344941, partial [Caerostris extrusa]